MYISNISYPYKDTWDVNHKYVTFDLENVDNTYANALRRLILTDVKYIGFRTRPYQKCDINVIVNETTMDNQKLTHRVGLIPINILYPEKFNVDDYQFYIEKSNDGHDVIEVTSQDFKIKNLSTNKDLTAKEVKEFFPPDKITGDYYFICYLLPDKTGSGENGGKLHFTAKASLRTAREDAKYNVAQTSFINKKDPVKVAAAWKEYYNKFKNDGDSKSVLENRFNITEAYRNFHQDSHGRPNKFEFFIESYNILPPLVVLHLATQILEQKLKKLSSHIQTSNYNEVDIYPSETDMHSFDILINSETHTIGALLQSYIIQYFMEIKNIVSYVGYTKPHPLKDNILLRIALVEEQNNKSNVVKVVDKAISQLIKMNRSVQADLEKNKIVIDYLKKA